MRWKTGPWRTPRLVQGVERQLVECVADGLVFDGAAVQSNARRHPGTKLLQVPAGFLEDLLLSRIAGLVPDPRGVRLTNCMVTGALDLSRAAMQPEQVDRAVLPLACERVVFEEPIRLDYASTGAISLTLCRLPGFYARGADIGSELTMDDCTICRRATDITPEYLMIDVDGATIGGDFHARRLRYEQEVDATASSGRDAPETISPPGPLPFANVLIDADNASISGGVDLSVLADHPTRTLLIDENFAVLMGNFDNAHIFGDFRAVGARFSPTLQGAHSGKCFLSDRYPKCLDLRGAQVRGDVALDHIRTAGEIHLEDATLTQDLSIGGARLVNVECAVKRLMGLSGAVIEGMGLAVGGSVHFVDRRQTYHVAAGDAGRESSWPLGVQDETRNSGSEMAQDGRLLAVGTIRLTRARITGDLDASGATICAVGRRVEGVALDMRSAELGGTLFLDGRRDVGPGLFIGLVNLINIKVSGSVIFCGSWFRAPAGQQMGPQRIHLPVLEDWPENAEPLESSEDEWSPVDRTHIARTDRELDNWQRNQLWRTCPNAVQLSNDSRENAVALADRERPFEDAPASGQMLALLERLGVRSALELTKRQLWRLRGGCRAIAMVDAQVTGSVLFGIGPTAWGTDRTARKADGNGRDGPSIVVGCVDLDRIRIDGNLRLTGGVFRAVTPVIPGSAPEVLEKCDEPAVAGSPASDTRMPGGSQVGGCSDGQAEVDPRSLSAVSDSGAPDVSLSNPSTPGWTELKARVCLSLRSADIKGRFESKYFGPVPLYLLDKDIGSGKPILQEMGVITEKIRTANTDDWKSRFEKFRQYLHIVPEFQDMQNFLEEITAPGKHSADGNRVATFNDPSRFVDEMVAFLDFAATAESIDDQSLGATLPALPRVHNPAGWYPLRPDGLFDLSGAAIRSIHDHPCHGWPTSDGHLELNGCTYDYLSLSHEPSYRVVPNVGANAEAGDAGEARDRGEPGHPNLVSRAQPEGPTERYGSSVAWRVAVWCWWRLRIFGHLLAYGLRSVPYWACRAACWLGLANRGKPRCSALFPEQAKQYNRLYTLRYIEYAVTSFRIRNDNLASPEARRIKWLEQQYPGAGPRKHDFRPQPYEQLARVMRATGYTLDADSIAAAKRNMRWRAGVFGVVQRAFDIFLFLTSRYTYSPALIASWLGGLILLGVLISGGAFDRMMLVPLEGSGEFSPWLYAGDVIIPIVEFGYVDKWSIVPTHGPLLDAQQIGQPGFVVADTTCVANSAFADTWPFGPYFARLSDAVFAVFGIDGARGVEWAFGLLTGFGSLFTALAVITFTGVMRRD